MKLCMEELAWFQKDKKINDFCVVFDFSVVIATDFCYFVIFFFSTCNRWALAPSLSYLADQSFVRQPLPFCPLHPHRQPVDGS